MGQGNKKIIRKREQNLQRKGEMLGGAEGGGAGTC